MIDQQIFNICFILKHFFLADLKKNISRLIHTEPANIAIIGNTSEGFNWLANGLTWNKGDRILLVEDEFPSNVYPFLHLKSRGVEIDFVPTRDGMIYLKDIEKSITNQTKLLSISFVEFFTGFRNDLNEIGKSIHLLPASGPHLAHHLEGYPKYKTA